MLQINGYKDLRLTNKAVWFENTTLDFSSDGDNERSN